MAKQAKQLAIMSKAFTNDLHGLDKTIHSWKRKGIAKLKKAMRKSGVLLRDETRRRVPVKTNTLKKGINTVTYRTPDGFTTEVGTNVRSDTGFPYPVVLEYGSRHIAGGRVVALGNGNHITDADAIKDWPAKSARGGKQQQMPFLRPAFNFVLPRVKKLIDDAFVPPPPGKLGGIK